MKTNTIYCGDCAEVLMYFPEESVDLIYVDPPFFSNKKYEVIWGDGYEIRAFEDRWKGGINNYIAWMEPKIRECHRVLKPTGSMYLHCDWHANAYLRILMDKIFGGNNFRNEIIWHYKRWTASKKSLPRLHDTIFFYAKSPSSLFNSPMTPNINPNPSQYVSAKDKNGKTIVLKDKSGKPIKRKISKEIKIGDVWDISLLSPVSKERLGYPTQKPERLLERIIKASSNPTDIVLDPMCGCGTAIAAAQKLGRRWIGIDVSPTACKLMVKRMRSLKVHITDGDIVGLPKSIEDLKKLQPFEFQNWVIQKMHARVSKRMVGDFGVDGWIFDGTPIQVKQSERVGRNVIDNFETAIRRADKNKGIVVAFSFGKGAYEEVARVKLKTGLKIELKKVEELAREI